jgi:pantoate--beta-alanine ligase
MIIASTIAEVRAEVAKWRAEGLTVGLVPTMGALHEGHASLVKAAIRDCDRVVTSVFVNPTQFAKGEDLESYPRDFEKDCQVLENEGCHLVFHPDVAEMYPDGFATYTEVTSPMVNQLCGRTRPGHFKGVCIVVAKLFNIVTPDRAYFGEKDAQQLAVIKQMVRDMNFPLEVVGCPTLREHDGLAKSSRNLYLSKEERAAAECLYESMEQAKAAISKGARNSQDIVDLMTGIIDLEPLATIDYIEIVDGEHLLPVTEVSQGSLVALAVNIGSTRLIDNFSVLL